MRVEVRQAKTHEVAESIPVTPQMYQRLTAKIAGKAEERILSYLMLRSLKQARYSEKNVGHFALASASYTHFTSPIRRYPDLIVHRLLRELIQGGANPEGAAILSDAPQPWQERPTGKGRSERVETRVLEGPIPEAELGAIAAESSQSERRADDAERELIEWKKIKFMQDRVGEDFHAIILSCTKYGFFVELDDLFIEGLVPLSSLLDDQYFFRDTDRQIVGTRHGRVFRMGQRVLCCWIGLIGSSGGCSLLCCHRKRNWQMLRGRCEGRRLHRVRVESGHIRVRNGRVRRGRSLRRGSGAKRLKGSDVSSRER